jgi:hypothetical protein
MAMARIYIFGGPKAVRLNLGKSSDGMEFPTEPLTGSRIVVTLNFAVAHCHPSLSPLYNLHVLYSLQFREPQHLRIIYPFRVFKLKDHSLTLSALAQPVYRL